MEKSEPSSGLFGLPGTTVDLQYFWYGVEWHVTIVGQRFSGRSASNKWVKKLKYRLKLNLGVQRLPGSPRFSGQNRRKLDLARILLVHGELAPRLALQTILQAGGYAVDVAATPAEALSKIDECVYDLVLSDAEFAVGHGGTDLLAYARIKDYRPATALINSHDGGSLTAAARNREYVSIHTENVPSLLEKVADLIGLRASRRYRPLRRAG